MQDYQKTWNNRYGGGKYLFGKNPNEYLKSKLDILTANNILLPGDGEGRNAIYAAQNGWNVTSVDFSKIALERAREFANKSDVKINFVFKNLITEELPKNQFDVIGISFLHFNGTNKLIVHQKLNKALKVGGYVIFECFSESQTKINTGGPRKKDSLYNTEELKRYYPNFEFLELEDTKVVLNEGNAHIGNAYVVRMFARKLDK